MRGERDENALNPYLSRITEFLWVIVNNNFKQHSIFLMVVKSCEQNHEERYSVLFLTWEHGEAVCLGLG